MRKVLFALAGAAALVCGGATAHAAKFSPYMASLSLGGGYSDFTRPAVRDVTSGAGTWDARLTVGTRSPLALEAAYTGAAGAEQDPTAPDPTYALTQVTGSARINLTTWRVQPFIVGGVGWANLHSYGRDQAPVAAAQFNHNDNGVAIPVGGGLAGYIGRHGLLEARGGYDFLTDMKGFAGTSQRPDMWSAELRAGYAF